MTSMTKEELRKQIRDVVYKHLESRYLLDDGEDALKVAVDIMPLVDAYSNQREVEARIIENESMKESVAHGYTWDGRDWCHNHDKHVSQCYGCREAKWGNIFCKRFAVIIDERLADLRAPQPLSPEQKEG